MGKVSQKVEVNNFIKGFITEASVLNFPANASQDEENFELNRNGTRNRRLGMGYEEGGAPLDISSVGPLTTSSVSKMNTYVWKSVAGDSSKNFLVVKFKRDLYFYNLDSQTTSGSGYVGQTSLLWSEDLPCDFTDINGQLLVVSGYASIGTVRYEGGVFIPNFESWRVRDVWGVHEGVDDTSRFSTISQTHIYNLQNQSWGLPRKNSSGVLSDPVTIYKNDLGVYPSNSEMVWPGLQFQPVNSGVIPYERIFTNLYQETFGAQSTAAKGHFILDLCTRGLSRRSNVEYNKEQNPTLTYSTVSVPQDGSVGGATTIARYAGRVWYAGFPGDVVDGDFNSPDISKLVLFSQLVKSIPDIGKCYTADDPTSRETAGVVDTDGGFVTIPEANNIVKLVDVENGIAVIAENGVWLITGGSEDGFKASNYQVIKVSSSGCRSPGSIIREGPRTYYWSEDGIYILAKSELGGLSTTNLTAQTIQTFYSKLPNEAFLNVKGAYDPFAKKIKWLYRTGELFTSQRTAYELVLDTTVGAFYKMRYSSNQYVDLISAFQSGSLITNDGISLVYSGAEQVIEGASDVIVPDTAVSSTIQSIKYVGVVLKDGVSQIVITYLNNTSFLDWQEIDGVGSDAKAFVITGALTGGDSSVAKQIPYLTVHFTRTEVGVTNALVPDNPSGCLIRTMWDWSSDASSNKWSPSFQAYRYRLARYSESSSDPYDTGFKVISSKSKIRGRGRAFSLYMETEPYKDCKLLGWSLTVTGNTV